jgi:hypothetical protein
VAEDVDKAWEELGKYIMQDVLMYGKWNANNPDSASISFAQTVDEVRAENKTHRIMTVDEAVAHVKSGSPISLLPLAGGLPAELAWKYLNVVHEKVMPQLG